MNPVGTGSIPWIAHDIMNEKSEEGFRQANRC
jgi:hypothetical protein